MKQITAEEAFKLSAEKADWNARFADFVERTVGGAAGQQLKDMNEMLQDLL